MKNNSSFLVTINLKENKTNIIDSSISSLPCDGIDSGSITTKNKRSDNFTFGSCILFLLCNRANTKHGGTSQDMHPIKKYYLVISLTIVSHFSVPILTITWQSSFQLRLSILTCSKTLSIQPTLLLRKQKDDKTEMAPVLSIFDSW